MIGIPRTVAAPAVLTAEGGRGDRERQRAIAYFTALLTARAAARQAVAKAPKKGQQKPATKRKTFTFGVYKDEQVKQALAALFGRKCAYCESVYADTGPMEVEHWRPKGGIITADGRKLPRGYYWLACEWANLLPSCVDCNRERHQITLPTGEKKKAGKAEHFPLKDETRRATTPNMVPQEEPLLLNPCEDAPGDHLEFFEADGRTALLRPRSGSPRGQASIDIYGLNREGLVLERREHLALLKGALKDLGTFQKGLSEHGASAEFKAACQERYDEKVRYLLDRRLPLAKYAALARAYVDPQLEALGIALDYAEPRRGSG
jgi:uncharacterized protein (TIGR02646 family)